MNKLTIFTEKGKLLTTSLHVAEVFKKRHDNVLRDIENLGCSKGFTALNFEVSEYIDSSGKSNPMYKMTRDGWTLLVMGYNGKKAMEFKEAYIKAFNKMEFNLKYPPAYKLYVRSTRNYINDRPLTDLFAEWKSVYIEPNEKSGLLPRIIADMFNGWLVTNGHKRQPIRTILSMLPNGGVGFSLRKEVLS